MGAVGPQPSGAGQGGQLRVLHGGAARRDLLLLHPGPRVRARGAHTAELLRQANTSARPARYAGRDADPSGRFAATPTLPLELARAAHRTLSRDSRITRRAEALPGRREHRKCSTDPSTQQSGGSHRARRLMTPSSAGDDAGCERANHPARSFTNYATSPARALVFARSAHQVPARIPLAIGSKQKSMASSSRLSHFSNGSTPIADDAESSASPGVPTAPSPADDVLAPDDNQRSRRARRTSASTRRSASRWTYTQVPRQPQCCSATRSSGTRRPRGACSDPHGRALSKRKAGAAAH